MLKRKRDDIVVSVQKRACLRPEASSVCDRLKNGKINDEVTFTSKWTSQSSIRSNLSRMLFDSMKSYFKSDVSADVQETIGALCLDCSRSVTGVSRCNFCEKAICAECILHCSVCTFPFCTTCATRNYSQRDMSANCHSCR